MSATLIDALIVAGITAAVNGLVTWGIMTERIAALRERVARVEDSADKAHSRIDGLLTDKG